MPRFSTLLSATVTAAQRVPLPGSRLVRGTAVRREYHDPQLSPNYTWGFLGLYGEILQVASVRIKDLRHRAQKAISWGPITLLYDQRVSLGLRRQGRSAIAVVHNELRGESNL